MATKIITEMQREDFCKHFIRGICKNPLFSRLVTAGASDLSVEEKDQIKQLLQEISPDIAPNTDQELDDTVTAIVSRAVRIR